MADNSENYNIQDAYFVHIILFSNFAMRNLMSSINPHVWDTAHTDTTNALPFLFEK